VWDVIIVRIFHERKFIQAKKETTRDIFLLECERDNKNNLSLFTHKQLRLINFDFVQCDGLDFAKRCIS
jgi:hypothetical protein